MRKFQLRVIPIGEFKPDKKEPSDQEILEGHFTWETDWLAKTLKEEELNTGKNRPKSAQSTLGWRGTLSCQRN